MMLCLTVFLSSVYEDRCSHVMLMSTSFILIRCSFVIKTCAIKPSMCLTNHTSKDMSNSLHNDFLSLLVAICLLGA